jgi:hypothetical protein
METPIVLVNEIVLIKHIAIGCVNANIPPIVARQFVDYHVPGQSNGTIGRWLVNQAGRNRVAGDATVPDNDHLRRATDYLLDDGCLT